MTKKTKLSVLGFSELLWIILNFLALPFSYSPGEKPFGIGEKKAKNLIKKWSGNSKFMNIIFTSMFLLVPLLIVLALTGFLVAVIYSISKEFIDYMGSNNYGFFEALWSIILTKMQIT